MHLAALLLAAAAASPQGIALASVEAQNGAAPALAGEYGDALLAALVADGRLRAVERQQIAKVMKEQALSMSGAVSDETQVKVAQLVGARYVAVATIQPRDKSLVLSLRAVDSSSAQVVFADSVTAGGAEQIAAASQQLVRKLADKLAGGTSAIAGNAPVGDFDTAAVKEGAHGLAQSLALRFPRLTGHVAEALPDGTLSCAFEGAQPFAGQFFEIDGKDEVTGQVAKKGYFLLGATSGGACGGKVKREPGAAVAKGDELVALALKIDVGPIEPAAGAQPELARLLQSELRASLDTVPNFRVASDPQLTALGRVTGPRGTRTVELQVLDRSGAVLQKLSVPVNF